ncbi:protease FtsH-inhibitory lysogeny factor CIII [Serratia sp. JSRIV004]|uniref:protease FtsH-inhibitory lysogeny factor CIII n=1 Tax=Serratia sp. JSRIV004 TaxID=2831895 RepID=UPI0035302EAC
MSSISRSSLGGIFLSQIQESPMQELAFAGCPSMGAQYESLLERITRRMRVIGRWLKDTLNQRGEP